MLPIDDKVKLLELRRLMWSFSFVSQIDGPLATKKGPRANREKERIAKLIKESVSEYGWEKSPRAKLSVSFGFVDTEQNKADITKLVKFYLDLLEGPIFDDDRQVHYLEAATWRVESSSRGQEKSTVIIQVRQLSDYIRLLDYASEIDLDFEEDDECEKVAPMYSLEPDIRTISEVQARALSNLRISICDRPGARGHVLQTIMYPSGQPHLCIVMKKC